MITITCEVSELRELVRMLGQDVATSKPHNVSNVSTTPYIAGTYPANFEEAPVETLPGDRNKYGRYDQDVSPEIDAEIMRLRFEGRDCREIAAEIEKSHGIRMHYRRVQGRLSVAGREAKKSTNSLAEADIQWIKELAEKEWTPEEIAKELSENGVPVTVEKVVEVLG